MGISQQFIYIYIYIYILKNATKIENNLFKIRNIPPLLEAFPIWKVYKHQHTFYRECLLKNVIILQKFSEKRTQLICNAAIFSQMKKTLRF